MVLNGRKLTSVRRAILLLTLLLSATTAIAETLEQRLEALQPLPLPQRNCWFEPRHVIYDRWPDGSPRTVMAALLADSECGTELVVLRVARAGRLRRIATGPAPARDVELFDITGDDVPELFVQGPHGNRSTSVEILQWDGRRLTSLGETVHGAQYVDLDGDGRDEILTSGYRDENECGVVASGVHVDRLQNGRFVPDKQTKLAAVLFITNETGEPETRVHSAFLTNEEPLEVRFRVLKTTMPIAIRARRFTDHDEPKAASVPVPLDGTPFELPSRCTLLDVTTGAPAGEEAIVLAEFTSSASTPDPPAGKTNAASQW